MKIISEEEIENINNPYKGVYFAWHDGTYRDEDDPLAIIIEEKFFQKFSKDDYQSIAWILDKDYPTLLFMSKNPILAWFNNEELITEDWKIK